MKNKLTGLFAALPTLFSEDESVNREAMIALGEKVAAQGLDGFYLTGSTGECFLQSPAERKEVAEIMIPAFRDRMIIIAHIGAIGVKSSVDLARHAEKLGAHAVSSIPPIYYPFSKEEILDYYIKIAEGVSIPVIPYNFPDLSGVTIDSDDICGLREQSDRFTGIKFTSSALNQIITMKRSFPDFTVYNGYDELFLAGLSFGADGAIGSTFNFIGSLYRRLFAAFQSEEMEKARSLQREANEIIEVVARIGINGALKYILSCEGIAAGVCRKPFAPLTDEEKRELDRLYEERIASCRR